MSLESNLKALCYAIESPDLSSPLVANYSKTTLYSVRSFYGRFWCWFYKIQAYLTQTETYQKNLHDTILSTHLIFLKTVSLYFSKSQEYQEYLVKASNGDIVNERAFFSSRSAIIEGYKKMAPFLSRLQKKTNAQLVKIFENCFPEKKIEDLFLNQETLQLFRCKKIIDLEGVISGPIPLKIFKKIYEKRVLQEEEKADVVDWINKVNKMNPSLNLVHSALKSMSYLFNTKNEKKEIREEKLYGLELYLAEENLSVFNKQDRECLLKYQLLKTGSKVLINNQEYTLDQRLKGTCFSKDIQLFSLVEDKKIMMLAAHNELFLHLKNLKMRKAFAKKQDLLSVTSVVFSSLSKSYALMVKLKPLDAIEWVSVSEISKSDQTYIKSIATYIQEYVKKEESPYDLKPDVLLIDDTYKLHLIENFKKSSYFEFNTLEQFLFRLSSGNLIVFKTLMDQSGLTSRMEAKYYLDFVGEDRFDAETLAKIHQVKDYQCVILAEKIKNLLKEYEGQMRGFCRGFLPEKEYGLIRKTFIDCYALQKTRGLLWPTIFTDVKLMLEKSKDLALTEKMSLENQRNKQAIIGYIQELLKKEMTPYKLSLSSIKFDEKGSFKMIETLKEGYFNFNLLEDFVFQFSSGDLSLFQVIMEQSTLYRTQEAKYYIDFLKEDRFEAEPLAKIYAIKDYNCVLRAIFIKKQLRLWVDQMVISFKNTSLENKEGFIRETFIKEIVSHKTASLLWPTLFTDVQAILNLQQRA